MLRPWAARRLDQLEIPYPSVMKTRVEIWSDIACPWCWVGKRNLEAALDSFEGEVELLWRAFELDPSAPEESPEGVDNVARLARKYRVPREAAQAMIDRMVEVGASRGLEFRFDRLRPSNTFDAHRLLRWATSCGLQGALKEQLFQAYMRDGRQISDHEVLVDLAASVGLDPDRTQAILSSDAHGAEVREDEAIAGQLGITGVPFFVIEGRYALSGAQPPELLLKGLRQAAAEAEQAQAERSEPAAEGETCGPDGCALPSSTP